MFPPTPRNVVGASGQASRTRPPLSSAFFVGVTVQGLTMRWQEETEMREGPSIGVNAAWDLERRAPGCGLRDAYGLALSGVLKDAQLDVGDERRHSHPAHRVKAAGYF